jgi:hypothetical protein
MEIGERRAHKLSTERLRRGFLFHSPRVPALTESLCSDKGILAPIEGSIGPGRCSSRAVGLTQRTPRTQRIEMPETMKQIFLALFAPLADFA